jgi:HK97 family phage prohead protease
MQKEQKELRTFVASELRATGSDKQPKIEGYAATFAGTADLGAFREKIAPGAFQRTLASERDVVCLYNHDNSMLLGRKSAGTLTLQEDSKGLRFSCDLPDTSTARDVYANLRAGNLKECSFGFFVDGEDGESWEQQADGGILRTLRSVNLFDVSVVTFPAYTNTEAAARNVVSPQAEARMSSLARAQGTETRRKRADSLLAEIAQEDERRQAEREQSGTDEQLRARLAFLKYS